MIPILLGLGGVLVTSSVIEKIDREEEKSKPTVKEEMVSSEYVRQHFAKSGRKLRKAGD